MVIAITVAFLLTVIAGAIYIFLIMPRVSDRADMDMLITDYAHRGLHSKQYPENSLPAFFLAVQHGYGIELDVQLSADGEVMVFHDVLLKRMCGVNSKLSVNKRATLTALRLGNTQYTIPTLEQVLTLVDGRVPLLIEIKGDGKEESLCERLSEMLDVYSGAFAIQSFNPQVLRWFKKHRPRFARGQLFTGVKEVKGRKAPKLCAFMLSNMLFNVLSRPDFISVSGTKMKNLSFRLCVSLFKCRGFVWTVRNQKQYRACHRKSLHTIFERFLPD